MEQTTKPITSEQRRMLSKLYEKKVEERVRIAREKRSKEEEKLEKEVLSTDAKDLVDRVEAWRKLEEACVAAREALEARVKKEDHFHFSTYGGSRNSYLSVNGSHPKLKKFAEETHKQNVQMDEAKDKILTNIWGLDASYGELVKMIDKEFGAIGA